jgi:hypothetical protein
MKQWISPPEFVVELERAQALREEDTAYWIFEEPKFKKWQQSGDMNRNDGMLWVQGT